jgi:hypothetical protein
MKSETIKYAILEQLLTENRVNQVIEAYPCLPPYMIKYLSENDPSGNNKYLAWMCKMIYDENGRFNDGHYLDYTTVWTWLDDNYDSLGADTPHSPDKCKETWNNNGDSGSFNATAPRGWEKNFCDLVLEDIIIFHRVSASLEIKDINAYRSLDQLTNVLALPKIKVKEKELAKDVTKIYEDDTWLMMSPKSHAASCVYGSNTKWCVTMRDNPDYFNRYTREDFYLIFVMNKKNNNKWAINTKEKLDAPSEDKVIDLPWHKEIELGRRNNTIVSRFTAARHNASVENTYKHRGYETTYWNAEDYNISWTNFIEESKLPTNLQHLLKAIEKRVIVNFQRKKKGDIAHEVNPNPIRLKKGDHVKLLASGYGLYRGDEGIVTSTMDGAPGRQKELNPNDAGKYRIHVPGRETTQGRTDTIKQPDGTNKSVPVVIVGGNFLEKIIKPKKKA